MDVTAGLVAAIPGPVSSTLFGFRVLLNSIDKFGIELVSAPFSVATSADVDGVNVPTVLACVAWETLADVDDCAPQTLLLTLFRTVPSKS